MKNLKLFSLLLALNLLTGCGYRWQPDFPDGARPTVTVPFVKGDEDGLLTAEIIRTLSSSGLANAVSFGGKYRLEVAIQNSAAENIGYRVDPQKVDGKVRHNLLACEGRKTMVVQAKLFRGDELTHGPFQITADAEYDYVDGDSIQDLTFVNPQGQVVTVLPFSLGQLEAVESAQEAARTPLYHRIAQKIVDALFSIW